MAGQNPKVVGAQTSLTVGTVRTLERCQKLIRGSLISGIQPELVGALAGRALWSGQAIRTDVTVGTFSANEARQKFILIAIVAEANPEIVSADYPHGAR